MQDEVDLNPFKFFSIQSIILSIHNMNFICSETFFFLSNVVHVQVLKQNIRVYQFPKYISVWSAMSSNFISANFSIQTYQKFQLSALFEGSYKFLRCRNNIRCSIKIEASEKLEKDLLKNAFQETTMLAY